tara:strand:- start:3012 stop:4409 length:1398 start_codon:yes stop_codon:yes gene_type:complete
MKKVIIIGAGITGLSAAWKLSENGFEILVVESEKDVGGLAKSIKIDNYKLDLGPHSFFTEDKEIYNKIIGLFKNEESAIPFSKRSVKMYFRGNYVDYPLSVKSVLFQMGIVSPILSTLSFLKSYIRTHLESSKKKKQYSDEELTVEKWAIDNFGKYLFLNFFKPYTEQFWKIKTSELSHRVIPAGKKMDFAKTLKHLLIKKYLEISRREPGSLSLVERESLPSYYPKNGFGEIADRIAKEVTKNKGKIITSCNVEKIIFGANTIKVETTKEKFDADYLISTIPLNKLLEKFEPNTSESILNCSKELEYLSLVLVYIITKKKDVLNCQYCYFVDKPYNRISEMNNFSEKTSPQNENILSIEISCHFNDKTWNLTEDQIFNTCMESIEKDKLLKKSDVLDYKVIKVPSVYPIYKKNYDKKLSEVNNYLKKFKNFDSIGRQGQFYYGDIDQMARIGFDTADKIIKKNN